MIQDAEDPKSSVKDTESDNLYEDWLKSSSNPSPDRVSSIQTVVVKSVAQSYQDMFQNIYLASEDGVSDVKVLENSHMQSTAMSFASPKENTASVIEQKDLSRTFYASILEQAKESEFEDELSQVFCARCNKLTSPIVSLRLKRMNVWNSLRYAIQSLKCCSNDNNIHDYHEYVYSCTLCKSFILQKQIIFK
jgi:hypothetical protein